MTVRFSAGIPDYLAWNCLWLSPANYATIASLHAPLTTSLNGTEAFGAVMTDWSTLMIAEVTANKKKTHTFRGLYNASEIYRLSDRHLSTKFSN
jgi:hypothetical protein